MLICGCEPDLLIDGIGCADQHAAHNLTRFGWIRPAGPGVFGETVAAELTSAGWLALSDSGQGRRAP